MMQGVAMYVSAVTYGVYVYVYTECVLLYERMCLTRVKLALEITVVAT